MQALLKIKALTFVVLPHRCQTSTDLPSEAIGQGMFYKLYLQSSKRCMTYSSLDSNRPNRAFVTAEQGIREESGMTDSFQLRCIIRVM